MCQTLLKRNVQHVVVTGDITHRGRMQEWERFRGPSRPLDDRGPADGGPGQPRPAERRCGWAPDARPPGGDRAPPGAAPGAVRFHRAAQPQAHLQPRRDVRRRRAGHHRRLRRRARGQPGGAAAAPPPGAPAPRQPRRAHAVLAGLGLGRRAAARARAAAAPARPLRPGAARPPPRPGDHAGVQRRPPAAVAVQRRQLDRAGARPPVPPPARPPGGAADLAAGRRQPPRAFLRIRRRQPRGRGPNGEPPEPQAATSPARPSRAQSRKALFICGSVNQTRQMHADRRALPECEARFTHLLLRRPAGAAAPGWACCDFTHPGLALAQAVPCATCAQHGLPMDHEGRRQDDYDLVVTCSDVVDAPATSATSRWWWCRRASPIPSGFWFWARKLLPFVPALGGGHRLDRHLEPVRPLLRGQRGLPRPLRAQGRRRRQDRGHRHPQLRRLRPLPGQRLPPPRLRPGLHLRHARDLQVRQPQALHPARGGHRRRAGAAGLQAAPQRGPRAQHPRRSPAGPRGAGLSPAARPRRWWPTPRCSSASTPPWPSWGWPWARRCTATSTSTSCGACCPCRAAAAAAQHRRGLPGAAGRASRGGRGPAVPAPSRRRGRPAGRRRCEDRRRWCRRAWARRACPGKVLMPVAGATLLERMLERVRGRPRRWTRWWWPPPPTPPTSAIVDAVRAPRAGLRLRRPPHRSAGPPPAGGRAPHRRRRGGEDPLGLPADRSAHHRPGGAASSARPTGDYDFVSNLHPASYPDGNDVEVMSARARWRPAWREAAPAARARAHHALHLGPARALPHRQRRLGERAATAR